jgi:hypothetical protein
MHAVRRPFLNRGIVGAHVLLNTILALDGASS